MKAILLAAGVGSRLGSLAKETPKCLLPINGRPLLDIWFERLAKSRVQEVFINLHCLPERVESFLAEQQYNLRVTKYFEPVLLGSAGTIREAKKFIGEDAAFFIIYADNLALIDLNKLREFHDSHPESVLSLLAYPTDRAQACGILEFDTSGRVIGFEEKPAEPKTNFANSGIHVASRQLFEYLPEHTPADLGFDVLPRLVGRMYGYVTNELILDIGTPQSYIAAQSLALTN